MRADRRSLLTVLCLCAAAVSRAGAPFQEEAAALLKDDLSALRLNESDLRLGRGVAEMPHTIDATNSFFSRPFDFPRRSAQWADDVENADNSAELFETAFRLLRSSAPFDAPRAAPRPPARFPAGFPETLKPIALELHNALARAVPLLERGVESIPPNARAGLLQLAEWPDAEGVVEQDISSRRTKARYAALVPFRQDDMLEAARIVLAAADRAVASLAAPSARVPARLRWPTAAGDLLVSGDGDDTYTDDDLKGVAVLIDLGGRNTYSGLAGAARENEIRVVIDMGADVTVADRLGSAGSGVFGIGALYLPNPDGRKTIAGGQFGQGAGIGGVGALIIRGPAQITGSRYVQGAGFFGAGLLSGGGSETSYLANRIAQGVGLVRGVGIFRHQGDRGQIKGGLVEPDPREPLGAISMCQGVGLGPRAYAGGGTGIAVVLGDGVSVQGSYFAQGCGYWHAVGVFRLKGNRSTLQARRYDLGSGVHYAFGYFDLEGNENRVLNWGVGPAYGWDHSVGAAFIRGNDNEFQTEWGAHTASIGSLSLSFLRGDRNRLRLGGVGSGHFAFNEAAYALHRFEGVDNRLQFAVPFEFTPSIRYMPNPWGVVRLRGGRTEKDLKLAPVEWAAPVREQAVRREFVDLQARMNEAAAKPAEESVADLVDVAAAFSVDKQTPREALRKLLLLSPDRVPALIDVIEPAAVDQLIHLRYCVPAHGDAAAAALLERMTAEPPPVRATLLNFLGNARPAFVSPALLTMPEERMALRTLSSMLNRDSGELPGLRAVMTALRSFAQDPSRRRREEARGLIGRIRLSEAFGLLATSGCGSDAEKSAFFDAAPGDLSEKIGDLGANALLSIVEARRSDAQTRLTAELAHLDGLEPVVRDRLFRLFRSTEATDVHSAVIGLGQIAHPADAPHFEPLMGHEKAAVREAVAVALGRMGHAGMPVLRRLMELGSPAVRAYVVTSALHSVVPAEAVALVGSGLRDHDPLVRLTAATVAVYPQNLLDRYRKRLAAMARKQLKRETEAEIRFILAQAAT